MLHYRCWPSSSGSVNSSSLGHLDGTMSSGGFSLLSTMVCQLDCSIGLRVHTSQHTSHLMTTGAVGNMERSHTQSLLKVTQLPYGDFASGKILKSQVNLRFYAPPLRQPRANVHNAASSHAFGQKGTKTS